MGTGLIVAFVVAIWAAYFVPLVLRRYDEASSSSSLEDLSPLSRRINHPATESETAPVPEPTPAVERSPESVVERSPASPSRSNRPAARRAARRRRRTLLTLLGATAIVGGVVAYGLVPVWSVAIPAGLVLAWLVACRLQVRHERGAPSGSSLVANSKKARAKAEKKARKRERQRARWATMARPVPSHDEEVTVVVSGQVEDVNPDRRHVMESTPLETDALDEQLVIAAPSVATTGDLVWDPLPVTVPTYVTKPRAGRTVRTIDFAQPGAWTSGHVEGEDVELPGHGQRSERASGDTARRAASQ